MTPPKERPGAPLDRLGRVVASAQEALKPKVEISPEVIEANQEMYDWLGLSVHLEEEAKQNKIIIPTPEQREAAEKAGYTTSLIIPGQITRAKLIEIIGAKYGQEFNSEGLKLWGQAETDLNKTEVAKAEATDSPIRPNQPYLIYIKPDLETNQAELDTMNKTFPECLKLLSQRNQTDPQLNLKGLTLTEYLLSQALITSQDKEKHLDTETWTWLLEEVVKDDQGQPARCLGARWYSDGSRLGVGSLSASYRDSDGGARFAAVP